MKKRTKIIITTTSIVSCLLVLHFFCGLFTPYNYFTAKWDIVQNKPKILKYGEALINDKQVEKIATKFGLKYDFVAGCIVTSPLVNGVEIYNSVITKYLNKKFGNDWKNKFDFQVDSLLRAERVDIIRNTILNIKKIKELDNYLDSTSNGKEHLYIWVLPQEKEAPNVRVCRKMPDGSIRVFYYFKVDPYSLQSSSIQY